MYQDFKDLLSAFHAHNVKYLISRDDLIASKLASGRTRDPADVEELREAADSQPPEAG
jgi:hypothetical protein